MHQAYFYLASMAARTACQRSWAGGENIASGTSFIEHEQTKAAGERTFLYLLVFVIVVSRRNEYLRTRFPLGGGDQSAGKRKRWRDRNQ